ncbi:hypothetical protein EVAR_100169_1, partial [Eumeta japonica]
MFELKPRNMEPVRAPGRVQYLNDLDPFMEYSVWGAPQDRVPHLDHPAAVLPDSGCPQAPSATQVVLFPFVTKRVRRIQHQQPPSSSVSLQTQQPLIQSCWFSAALYPLTLKRDD